MNETMSFDKMMDIMRNNFEHMQNSPLAKSLRKENRRLVKENKLLMSIIKDFHVSMIKNKDKKQVIIDLSNSEDEMEVVPPVKIKIEKTEKTDENIVYELIEKEEQTNTPAGFSQKEEEEEEEAEEEEEEAEEEEEEEEEEEAEEEEAEEEEENDNKGTVDSLEEETEVYEVTIRGKKYFTTDQKNGKIYAIDKDGDVGDEIGSFINGLANL
jgi:septum formation inhibitor MinC